MQVSSGRSARQTPEVLKAVKYQKPAAQKLPAVQNACAFKGRKSGALMGGSLQQKEQKLRAQRKFVEAQEYHSIRMRSKDGNILQPHVLWSSPPIMHEHCDTACLVM